VVNLCNNLPLAVRAIGAKLAGSNWLTIDEASRSLSEREQRIALLESAGFDLVPRLKNSYDELPVPAKLVLAAMSERGQSQIGVDEVCQLLDCAQVTSGCVLDSLVDANLLLQCRERYRLLDLVELCLGTEIYPRVPNPRPKDLCGLK
jgi:hypothetical protein